MSGTSITPGTPHSRLTTEPSVPAGPVNPPEIPGYEPLEILGRGGMGVVWRARQVGLDRIVALKVLPAELEADSARRLRFVREARLAGRLSHPNVVPVYDAGASGELLYYAMELVSGTPLSAEVRAGPLAATRVIELGAGIAAGLAHAHAQGVVHRDVKPDNVLVDAFGPRLLDFGIACAARTGDETSFTRTGAVLGTPRYMAPEQRAGGAEVGAPADVYALGLVLAEALTGQPALPAGSVPAWRAEPQLARLVARMLDGDPARRPTADEVARALTGMSTGPAASWARLERTNRMARAAGALVTALVLGSLLAPASRWFYDFAACLAMPGRLPPRVALMDTGPGPVSRARLARALAAFGAAPVPVRGVLVDVLMDRVEPAGPHGATETGELGRALSDARRRGLPVALVCSLASADGPAGAPVPELAREAGAIGFGNFALDPDHVVRRVPAPDHHPPLGLALAPHPAGHAIRFHAVPADARGTEALEVAARRVPLDALIARAPAALEAVADSYVVVGTFKAEEAYASDLFRTPLAAIGAPPVPGAWLHAEVVATWLDGKAPLTTGSAARLALAALGVMAGLALNRRARTVRALVVRALVAATAALPAALALALCTPLFADPMPWIGGVLAAVVATRLGRQGP